MHSLNCELLIQAIVPLMPLLAKALSRQSTGLTPCCFQELCACWCHSGTACGPGIGWLSDRDSLRRGGFQFTDIQLRIAKHASIVHKQHTGLLQASPALKTALQVKAWLCAVSRGPLMALAVQCSMAFLGTPALPSANPIVVLCLRRCPLYMGDVVLQAFPSRELWGASQQGLLYQECPVLVAFELCCIVWLLSAGCAKPWFLLVVLSELSQLLTVMSGRVLLPTQL